MDSFETGINWRRLTLDGGQASCADLDVEVEPTEAGGLVARSTRSGDAATAVLGAAGLQLIVGKASDDVRNGDIVVPLAPGLVGLTVALGNGALALTPQRALGLVWESTVDAAYLAAGIDEDGDGDVLVFAIDRSHLRKVQLKKSFGGTVRSAELTGTCILHLDPQAQLNAGGAFVKPERGAIARVLNDFVAA